MVTTRARMSQTAFAFFQRRAEAQGLTTPEYFDVLVQQLSEPLEGRVSALEARLAALESKLRAPLTHEVVGEPPPVPDVSEEMGSREARGRGQSALRLDGGPPRGDVGEGPRPKPVEDGPGEGSEPADAMEEEGPRPKPVEDGPGEGSEPADAMEEEGPRPKPVEDGPGEGLDPEAMEEESPSTGDTGEGLLDFFEAEL